jgi:MoaA/NifB/PqqE/SkfB family radical SAM enzyme
MFYPEPGPATLHLELSTKCNAACPMCSRNRGGFGVNPLVGLVNMSLGDIASHLSKSFVRNLKRAIVCGNFGDPLMNPEIVEIFRYFKEVNPQIEIELHTNGGIGSSETWKQLAQLVRFCRFGIDGLEDTNHVYRRGVKWDVLQKNVADFISAGGSAEWAFLVFKHNQHQLIEAEDYSRQMGFTKFIPKRTTRNIRPDGSYLEKWPAMSGEGKIDYFIEPPEEVRFQENLEKFRASQRDFATYQNYIEETKITCKVKKDGSVYLAADGLVLPCCWLGIDLVLNEAKAGSVGQLLAEIEAKKERLNIKNHKIEDILSSEFFNEVESRWAGARRLRKCAQVCGDGFDRFSIQF